MWEAGVEVNGRSKTDGSIMAKWVYSFGSGKTEGSAEMRNLLGGKGANLAEMASLGIPVPPGFTIPTDVCVHFYENENTYPEELKEQVESAMRDVPINPPESEPGQELVASDNPATV